MFPLSSFALHFYKVEKKESIYFSEKGERKSDLTEKAKGHQNFWNIFNTLATHVLAT